MQRPETFLRRTPSAAADLLGWQALGAPRWTMTGARPGAIYPVQLGLIIPSRKATKQYLGEESDDETCC